MQTCSVDGCDGIYKGRGLCHKHLQRLKRLGSTDLPTFADRFWRKVQKTETCWLWIAGTTQGYGYIGRGGRGEGHVFAHRASWEMHNGPIPDGMFVCHHCDVRLCVRPDHLFLGTCADNLADMRRKNRGHEFPHYVGSRNPSARLCEADVRVIKRRLRQGERSAAIAQDYPVGRTAIDWIAQGRTWQHVA